MTSRPYEGTENPPEIENEKWPRDRRSLLEITAVVATGLCHLVFEGVFHLKGPFIAAALLAWGVYLARSVGKDRSCLRNWGFRLDNLGRAWRGPAAVLAAGALLLAALGYARGNLRWNPHLPIIASIYPAWGIAQQFMLQAMVVRNLRGRIRSPVLVTLLAASLFAAVHLPDLILVGATFVLALLFTPFYLKDRNLLPLGIVHGLLGALAYFWLLGRDPFRELFS